MEKMEAKKTSMKKVIEKRTCPILECSINTLNKFIVCPHCQFESCSNCCKRYILDNTTPECMSCKKNWNDDFVDSKFTATFRNKELKKHKEDIILEKEKALLPETMLYLNRKKRKDKIMNKMDELKKELKKLKEELFLIDIAGDDEISNQIAEKRPKIVKACPNEKCNGFLDNKYTCGVCETKMCSKCEVIEIEGHVCNNDNVETVKMKRKECKACPNCSTVTYKQDGCSQVFCPAPCAKAWNFNTGKLDKGPIHAPNYYEYLRQQNGGNIPRNAGDNPCQNGGLPNARIFHNLRKNISALDHGRILDIHRRITHIEHNELQSFEDNNMNEFHKNLDLRYKFLENKIDEKKFKFTLQTRDKAAKKKQNIHGTLRMLVDVTADIFNKLARTEPVNGRIDTETFFKELDSLRKYYNISIEKTKKRFGCKGLFVSYLTPDWKLISEKK